MIEDEDSAIYNFLMLPELQFQKTSGKIERLFIYCIALLWCRDEDANSANKGALFKELTRENSIKFLTERLIRLSTILVYGRLKYFNINSN